MELVEKQQSIDTTLGTLSLAEPALTELAKNPLPIKAAYHVAKLVRLVAPEVKDFFAQRERLIRELGTSVQSPEGEMFQVTPENMKAFHARLGELADVAISIPWQPLRLSALGDITIAPSTLVSLGPLLEMEG